jgi:hypothetical protein
METDLPKDMWCGSKRLGLGREGGQQKNISSLYTIPY